MALRISQQVIAVLQNTALGFAFDTSGDGSHRGKVVDTIGFAVTAEAVRAAVARAKTTVSLSGDVLGARGLPRSAAASFGFAYQARGRRDVFPEAATALVIDGTQGRGVKDLYPSASTSFAVGRAACGQRGGRQRPSRSA